jgi:CRP-like cAMP-binding protein
MKGLVTLAEDLSLKTATARLAKFLYEMALAEGERAGKETLVRRDRLREEEIASLLGIVRVHVSRSLKRLASTGAIALSREVVRIPDLTALKRLFEGDREPS